jgi:hypothetical protein
MRLFSRTSECARVTQRQRVFREVNSLLTAQNIIQTTSKLAMRLSRDLKGYIEPK